MTTLIGRAGVIPQSSPFLVGDVFPYATDIMYAYFQQKNLYEEFRKKLSNFGYYIKTSFLDRKLRGRSEIYENKNFEGENYEVIVYIDNSGHSIKGTTTVRVVRQGSKP